MQKFKSKKLPSNFGFGTEGILKLGSPVRLQAVTSKRTCGTTFLERHHVAMMYGVLALFAGVITLMILHVNNGIFTYSLDDPYIHLALSEEIARGGYGINDGQHASPSSSILYPFLLAWAAPFTFHQYVPLVINLVAMLAAVEITRRFLLAVGFRELERGDVYATLLAGLIALVVNIFGVVSTGMEHSLQILSSLAILYGLARFLDSGHLDWWYVAAIIIGPAVRYENIAVSIAALVILACVGAWRPALLIGLAMAALVACFSIYLMSIGLPMLPYSVMAKSVLAEGAANGLVVNSLTSIIDNFHSRTLGSGQGIALMVLWLITAFRLILHHRYPVSRDAIWLSVFALLVIAAHALCGDYLQSRYEAYVYAIAVFNLLYLFGPHVTAALRHGFTWKVTFGAAVLCAVIGRAFLKSTILIPLASNNIYEQQFQMHRFVTEYLQKPVAVNDLGWVSYRNSNYVLDLWGLGSGESLRERKRGYTERSLRELVDANLTNVVIIYDRWFHPNVPKDWVRLANMRLGGYRITAGGSAVTFYSTDTEQAGPVKIKLRKFKKSLPVGVKMKLF